VKLAAKAAILDVPINFDRLWDETNSDYVLAVQAWVDEVEAVKVALYST
jgi:hypothetical protein